jgi:hypothetical protein
MGDRSNIQVIHPNGESVWLYGHWLGEENVRIVEEAILEGRRVSDPAYFTRILFTKMLKYIDPDLTGESGLGISTEMQDNDAGNDVVVVDYRRTVRDMPAVRREKPEW